MVHIKVEEVISGADIEVAGDTCDSLRSPVNNQKSGRILHPSLRRCRAACIKLHGCYGSGIGLASSDSFWAQV